MALGTTETTITIITTITITITITIIEIPITTILGIHVIDIGMTTLQTILDTTATVLGTTDIKT